MQKHSSGYCTDVARFRGVANNVKVTTTPTSHTKAQKMRDLGHVRIIFSMAAPPTNCRWSADLTQSPRITVESRISTTPCRICGAVYQWCGKTGVVVEVDFRGASGGQSIFHGRWQSTLSVKTSLGTRYVNKLEAAIRRSSMLF